LMLMNDGYFDKIIGNTRTTSSVWVLLLVAVMLLQLVQNCNTHQ
jgi:hypothetical protein